MRKSTGVLSLILSLLIFMSILAVSPAYAQTETRNDYLLSGHYEFNEDNSVTKFSTTLTENAKLIFAFDEETYIHYGRMEITNSSNKIVYSTTIYSVFEEIAVTTGTLSKGSYTITFYGEYAEEIHFALYKSYSYTLPKVKKIKLNKTKLTISAGVEKTLKLAVTPSNAEGTTKWKSSNSKVVNISNGLIYAPFMGKSTITATRGGKTAKCVVTVNKTFLELGKGKNWKIKSIVKYISGYKKAKWKSSDTSVAIVSGGKITAKKHGKANITAKIKGKKYTITVYSYDKKVIKEKTVKAIKDDLYVPSSFKLNTIKYPDDRTCTIYYSAKTRSGNRVYNAVTGYFYKNRFYHYDTFDD